MDEKETVAWIVASVSTSLSAPVWPWSKPSIMFILSWILTKQVQLRKRASSESVV